MTTLRFYLLFILLFAGCGLSAQSFTRLISFGDSLSDIGNLQTPTVSAPVSNGELWIQYLARDYLGIGSLTASNAGGTAYAWAGAASVTGFLPPSASSQIDYFLAADSFADTDLVTLWVGGNDFLDSSTTGSLIGPDALADRILVLLQKLVANGAKHILFGNLPDMGSIPRLYGTPLSAGASQWSYGYKLMLEGRLAALRASYPQIAFYYMDFFAAQQDIQANPGDYGLTNVNSAAGDSDTALFWDDIHPTTKGHSIVAAEAAYVLNSQNVETDLTMSVAPISGSSNVLVTLNAAGRGTYRLESSPTLQDWTTVQTVDLVWGTPSQIQLEHDGSHRFFRLVRVVN
jgi:outer membrane lipase/esterase